MTDAPQLPTTRLDEKLARIRKNPSGCSDFLICDAKDPDMARGIFALGRRPDGTPRNRQDFLGLVRKIVQQDVVDLMLLSPLNLHRLTIEEDAFAGTSVARAARVNDTTEIWLGRHARYREHASRPHRTAALPRVMRGASDGGSVQGADIGLYSVTFTNDLDADQISLCEYNSFRAECDALGFRHFLEVFNPNVGKMTPDEIGAFVNDCIVRTLAGMDRPSAPMFLKVAYNGPRAFEELVGYDAETIVGVLGGNAGTMRDTFELLHQVRRRGGRLALFGRKINQAEAPLDLIELLRGVADEAIEPQDAVRLYHNRLTQQGIVPVRELSEDMNLTDPILMA